MHFTASWTEIYTTPKYMIDSTWFMVQAIYQALLINITSGKLHVVFNIRVTVCHDEHG